MSEQKRRTMWVILVHGAVPVWLQEMDIYPPDEPDFFDGQSRMIIGDEEGRTYRFHTYVEAVKGLATLHHYRIVKLEQDLAQLKALSEDDLIAWATPNGPKPPLLELPPIKYPPEDRFKPLLDRLARREK